MTDHRDCVLYIAVCNIFIRLGNIDVGAYFWDYQHANAFLAHLPSGVCCFGRRSS